MTRDTHLEILACEIHGVVEHRAVCLLCIETLQRMSDVPERIRAARLEERERCAKIAEQYPPPYDACDCSTRIAKSIREGRAP